MLPPNKVAASLLKSGVDVIPLQVKPSESAFTAHVTPLSLDIYMDSALKVAAIKRKSGEAVIPVQAPITGVNKVTVLDGYDPAGTCTHAELPIALL